MTASEPVDSSGVAGMGKAGRFTVEILGQDNIWLLSVESPDWCANFRLVERERVAELATFLRTHVGRNEFAEMVIGSLGEMEVRAVKDDEFADRLFIRATGGGSLVEFSLVAEASQEFADAVTDAAQDLEM